MDLKWLEMLSKVNFGHPKWPINLKWTPKKKFCIDLKWPELLSKVNFRHPKWPIDLKWPEIQSKVIFEHTPAGGHFVKKNQKKKIPYRFEMARNAIESYFRTSKMAAGSHFVQNFKKIIKLRIDLKWP